MIRKDWGIIVLVSADEEWNFVRDYLHPAKIFYSPFGEWFKYRYDLCHKPVEGTFFQTGCGKIPASAATQFVIDKYNPKLIINLGTCGGFRGKVNKKDILLVTETIIYDIYERSGQNDDMINRYRCNLDLSWIKKPYPIKVKPAIMATADQDLNLEMMPYLYEKYGAIAADWESGAIAYVGHKINKRKCLILRGVSDLGDEIYEAPDKFRIRVREIMPKLLDVLPKLCV